MRTEHLYLALHILNSAWYWLLNGTVDTDAMAVIEKAQDELITEFTARECLSHADVIGLLGEIRAWRTRQDLPFMEAK